jgi:hypothetical protein
LLIFRDLRTLEHILQRELHDPRILRRRHLTEVAAVEIRDQGVHDEAVCNVKRLGSKFQLARFTPDQLLKQD